MPMLDCHRVCRAAMHLLWVVDQNMQAAPALQHRFDGSAKLRRFSQIACRAYHLDARCAGRAEGYREFLRASSKQIDIRAFRRERERDASACGIIGSSY